MIVKGFLRFALTFAITLAVIAWGASELFNRQARRWAERDTAMRARVVLAGARPALGSAGGESARVVDALVRDERLMGAAVCRRDGRTEAASHDYPHELACGRLPQDALAAGARGWDLSTGGAVGSVHVAVLPVAEEGDGDRLLVLVHDMSYVDRRADATRRYTFFAFALVGLVGAVLARAVARLTWRSWTAELRRLLVAPFTLHAPKARRFQPLLADVRDLVSTLTAEEARVGSAWTPERLRQILHRNLRGEGIVVVANREPYIHDRAPDGSIRVLHPASGLVTALEPIMRACSGTWIAHGSGTADRETVDAQDRVRVPPGEEAYTIRRIWLSKEEERGYYYGFSNEGLWPLCHISHTRPEFRVSDWEQYRKVNRRFAEAVAAEADVPDPIVLVQDYHYALLPKYLRELRPRATILTFWHIPWPNAERFGICPWERAILEGMLGSTIVGFHTQAHCNNFIESIDRFLESRIDRERQSVVLGGRETLVRAYPISIEWPSRWAAGAPTVPDCREEVRRELGLPRGAVLGVGVDRLDYTKGIEERLLAVERFLELHAEWRGRFTFAQVAAPSRTIIEAYRALDERVEALAERINGRFGTSRWRPIVMLRQHHEPPAVFKLYRAADLCYVSSLHDGMNLVAKEFVASRDDLRGVLVLSRFTGAARELSEALVVNPYDIEAAAAALHAAVEMAPEEQEERMRSMRALVAELNVYRWAGKMLLDATRARRQERLATRLSGGPAAEGA
ncbi:MAG TPA: trehalose-6-phosphate synthase [Anaeromyxobacteraceae bacterium]|nr:trehalose-6-phosphate synthase [Anaeromyxobacteraceae bacterium]